MGSFEIWVLRCGVSFWGCIVSEGIVPRFGRQISLSFINSVGEIGVNSILFYLSACSLGLPASFLAATSLAPGV